MAIITVCNLSLVITCDDGLHEGRVELHEDVEEVEREPGDEEDERDAQDHDVGPAPLLVVLGVLALKQGSTFSVLEVAGSNPEKAEIFHN